MRKCRAVLYVTRYQVPTCVHFLGIPGKLVVSIPTLKPGTSGATENYYRVRKVNMYRRQTFESCHVAMSPCSPITPSDIERKNER